MKQVKLLALFSIAIVLFLTVKTDGISLTDLLQKPSHVQKHHKATCHLKRVSHAVCKTEKCRNRILTKGPVHCPKLNRAGKGLKKVIHHAVNKIHLKAGKKAIRNARRHAIKKIFSGIHSCNLIPKKAKAHVATALRKAILSKKQAKNPAHWKKYIKHVNGFIRLLFHIQHPQHKGGKHKKHNKKHHNATLAPHSHDNKGKAELKKEIKEKEKTLVHNPEKLNMLKKLIKLETTILKKEVKGIEKTEKKLKQAIEKKHGKFKCHPKKVGHAMKKLILHAVKKHHKNNKVEKKIQ